MADDLNTAIKETHKWAAGGQNAMDLAAQIQAAKMNGESVPATKKNIATTVQAAIRMFLDGKIEDPEAKEILFNYGIDMDNIRQSLTEKVLINAIPEMIAKGDIPGLISLARAAGEDVGQNSGSGTNVVVQIATPAQIDAVDAHIDAVIDDAIIPVTDVEVVNND